ncbi:MAG: Na/Pi cotransporter family protein, partial [Clostridia bacterium]|nr:Na/Pi cotransporter family protein [Clostridia bacterium]
LLASMGANANSKRVALIHFTFNLIGTAIFAAIIWIFKDPIINLLTSAFPGSDKMSLQMRVSLFHVIFNVTTTLCLLPFVKQLVKYSCRVIKDKKEESESLSFKFVDDRLLSTPPVALMQVKKEIDYMASLVQENIKLSFVAMDSGSAEYGEKIAQNEAIIDFTNSELTKYLIRLSANVEASEERKIGAYFHALHDLERIGDHAENFHEIGIEMLNRNITFSDKALGGINDMRDTVIKMFDVSKDTFENLNRDQLISLTELEQKVDDMKIELIADHFNRLAEGNCSVEVSPYYSSVVVGLERVADHLVNVGYSIVNPTGSQKIEA